MVALMADLFRASLGHTGTPSEAYTNSIPSSRSQQLTSLPSFASLQEHTGHPHVPKEADISPSKAHPPCYSCADLKPLLRDIAFAAIELDESVQVTCNKSAIRVCRPVPAQDCRLLQNTDNPRVCRRATFPPRILCAPHNAYLID